MHIVLFAFPKKSNISTKKRITKLHKELVQISNTLFGMKCRLRLVYTLLKTPKFVIHRPATAPFKRLDAT